jgi:thioredoxin 1
MRQRGPAAAKLTMTITATYASNAPSRADVDRLDGPTLVEFGSPGCGHCRAVQAPLALALADHPRVRHLKIADGSGRPLGRSFRIRLWPTLVFLRDGREIARLVRPRDAEPIRDALAQIDAADAPASAAPPEERA